MLNIHNSDTKKKATSPVILNVSKRLLENGEQGWHVPTGVVCAGTTFRV